MATSRTTQLTHRSRIARTNYPTNTTTAKPSLFDQPQPSQPYSESRLLETSYRIVEGFGEWNQTSEKVEELKHQLTHLQVSLSILEMIIFNLLQALEDSNDIKITTELRATITLCETSIPQASVLLQILCARNPRTSSETQILWNEICWAIQQLYNGISLTTEGGEEEEDIARRNSNMRQVIVILRRVEGILRSLEQEHNSTKIVESLITDMEKLKQFFKENICKKLNLPMPDEITTLFNSIAYYSTQLLENSEEKSAEIQHDNDKKLLEFFKNKDRNHKYPPRNGNGGKRKQQTPGQKKSQQKTTEEGTKTASGAKPKFDKNSSSKKAPPKAEEKNDIAKPDDNTLTQQDENGAVLLPSVKNTNYHGGLVLINHDTNYNKSGEEVKGIQSASSGNEDDELNIARLNRLFTQAERLSLNGQTEKLKEVLGRILQELETRGNGGIGVDNIPTKEWKEIIGRMPETPKITELCNDLMSELQLIEWTKELELTQLAT